MQVERSGPQGPESGKRESNTLVTYLWLGHNPEKSGLIPDMFCLYFRQSKDLSVREGPMAHQLVGRVMAYQGEDE